MTHQIALPDNLFARLQAHAVPFVDTPISVIERALDALEAGDEDAAKPNKSGIKSFNPAAAPNLAHSTPQKALVAGKSLSKGQVYWNPIMFAVIAEAASMGVSTPDLLDLITVNCVEGCKEDHGYKYLESVGISVQGQDANAAWKQAYRIASSVGIEVDVTFAWQANEKAAMPSTVGTLYVEGK